MKTLLVLNGWNDWLKPGSPDDARLFHSDSGDRIFVCPSSLGQGYVQEIKLRDDATLCIHDYTLDRDLVLDGPVQSNLLDFDFQIAGSQGGYSFFVPYFGLKEFCLKRSRQRHFKVKVTLKLPTLMAYFQGCMERLLPHTRAIAERIIQSVYQYQEGYLLSNTTGMLAQIVKGETAPNVRATYAHILAHTLSLEGLDLCYAVRTSITSEMKQTIGQILSCPYKGATRRTYLERKALKLVMLHLEATVQQRPSEIDLNYIYQAASILRNQLLEPPTLEALARKVCTNRFKLNQGFHRVYGITPFSYLRECRLMQAQQLLITSNLPVSEIAARVGYANRSHFALAFRQSTGINPKAYQMQAWQCTSETAPSRVFRSGNRQSEIKKLVV